MHHLLKIPEDFPDIVRRIFRSLPTIIEGNPTLFTNSFQVNSPPTQKKVMVSLRVSEGICFAFAFICFATMSSTRSTFLILAVCGIFVQ